MGPELGTGSNNRYSINMCRPAPDTWSELDQGGRPRETVFMPVTRRGGKTASAQGGRGFEQASARSRRRGEPGRGDHLRRLFEPLRTQGDHARAEHPIPRRGLAAFTDQPGALDPSSCRATGPGYTVFKTEQIIGRAEDVSRSSGGDDAWSDGGQKPVTRGDRSGHSRDAPGPGDDRRRRIRGRLPSRTGTVAVHRAGQARKPAARVPPRPGRGVRPVTPYPRFPGG